MAFTIDLAPKDEAYADLLRAISRALAEAFEQSVASEGMTLARFAQEMGMEEDAALGLLSGDRVPVLEEFSDACVVLGVTPRFELVQERLPDLAPPPAP